MKAISCDIECSKIRGMHFAEKYISSLQMLLKEESIWLFKCIKVL